MKPLYKIGLYFLCVFFSLHAYSQTDYAKEAEKDLTAKGEEFKTAKEAYEKELKSLLELTNSLDLKASAQLIKVRDLKTKADAILTQAEVLHKFYLQKGVEETALDAHFKIPTDFKGIPPILKDQTSDAVSYTHLTLPTILLV